MLSKCANPDCSERFRYFHQGKLFHLTPVPELQRFGEEICGHLYEGFWLCDECSGTLAILRDGLRAQVVPFPFPFPSPSRSPSVSLEFPFTEDCRAARHDSSSISEDQVSTA